MEAGFFPPPPPPPASLAPPSTTAAWSAAGKCLLALICFMLLPLLWRFFCKVFRLRLADDRGAFASWFDDVGAAEEGVCAAVSCYNCHSARATPLTRFPPTAPPLSDLPPHGSRNVQFVTVPDFSNAEFIRVLRLVRSDQNR